MTYVGEVAFAGLRAIEERIARRYVAMKSGNRLLPKNVQRTQRYLLSTGLFNRVRILVPGMDRGDDTLNVFIQVREAPFRFVEAGLGYVYPGRIASALAVGHQNVRGVAASLRLDGGIEGGWVGDRWQRTETAALSYYEPWFRALPIGAGSTIDYKRKTESASSYQSFGANVQVGRSWYDLASTFVRYQYRFRETEISGADTSDFLREEIERPITNSVSLTITLDSRDSFTEPHAGQLARLQVLHAGDFLGGDWSFRKLFADWSIYHEAGPVVVALRARVGVIRPLSGSPTAPDEERFRAGGANTVRGFEEEGLGPKDGDTPLGGEALALGNAEVRMPFADPLNFGLFFDVGQVWGTLREARVLDLEPAVGFGFRYRTIIGPVRVDWGIPLLERRKGRVYLTLGHAF
jgi:outer membrane protein insertion porin family